MPSNITQLQALPCVAPQKQREVLGFKREANLLHFLKGKSEICLIRLGGNIPTESVTSWFIHVLFLMCSSGTLWNQKGKCPVRKVLSWTLLPGRGG